MTIQSRSGACLSALARRLCALTLAKCSQSPGILAAGGWLREGATALYICGIWTRAKSYARRAITRPMKSARADGSADTHTRQIPTASSAGTQILLNLFRGVRMEDGSHQAAVTYGMELGSVTLKRIGFFCFPIKHSTHTGLFSVGSLRFRARTEKSALAPFLIYSPPCCDQKHRPVGWRCPGLSRTATIFLPIIFQRFLQNRLHAYHHTHPFKGLAVLYLSHSCNV